MKTKIKWNNYKACAYAEGFCEGEGAAIYEQLQAWEYIATNNLHTSLQGFYGRNVEHLKECGYLFDNGKLNWDNINEYLDNY